MVLIIQTFFIIATTIFYRGKINSYGQHGDFMIKQCKKCNESKPLADYFKSKETKDGYKSSCKSCCKAYDADYRQSLIHDTLSCKQCSKCNVVRSIDDFYSDKSNKSGYTSWCKQCISDKHKKPAKQKDETLLKLKVSIRCLIKKAIKRNGYTKLSSTNNILGCDYDTFKHHIESLFLDNMTWDNRDLWDIDHIVPVSYADNYDELILLNHYTNLRPLWKLDNQSKYNKLLSESINHPLYQHIIFLRTSYRGQMLKDE
jgi:hypothetical protein